MPTAIQVGAAGPYSEEIASRMVIVGPDNDVAIVFSATANGQEIEATGLFQSLTYIITHDAADGDLTIGLESSPTTGAPYDTITDDALIQGEPSPQGPSATLVIDTLIVANRVTLIVSICPAARRTLNGVFIAPMAAFHRLTYATDADWDGTSLTETVFGMHVPKAAPTP